MFYVDKNTLPRYWWAYAGHVEERIGTLCSNEGEFATEREAVAYADRLMQERTTREFTRISRRYSGVYLAVCHIRALWNEKIRDGLARYKAEREHARVEAIIPPLTVVSYAPDTIPVQGERLAIGTTVYFIDNHNPELRVGKITAEYISYYDHRPEGTAAVYQTDINMSVHSTLTTSYSNQEIYLDMNAARTRMRELLRERAVQINEQLRRLE